MALLYGVYILIFEKEKMHRFNRFFLLFSLVFSLAVPAISIDSTPTAIREPLYEFEHSITNPESIPLINSSPKPTQTQEEQPFDYPNIVLYLMALVYVLIGTLFSYRLIRNMYLLMSKAKKERIVEYKGAKLVLVENQVAPHSFLGYMFIHEGSYNKGHLDKHIITHELAHIKQRHSIDILFVEILKVVFWFNPVLQYYKKAMQLNHEFLADQSVIDSTLGIANYQSLLLNQIDLANNPALASSLNYSLTKKRLTMMRKKTSRTKALLIQATIWPLLAMFVLVFSAKAEAQDQANTSGSELVDEALRLTLKESLTDEERKKLSNITKTLLETEKKVLKHKSGAKKVYSSVREIKNDEQRNYINLLRIYNAKNKEYATNPDPALLKELESIHPVLIVVYENLDSEWKKSLKLQPLALPGDESADKDIDKLPPPPPPVKLVASTQHDASIPATYENILAKYEKATKSYLNNGHTDEQLKELLKNLRTLQILYTRLDDRDKERLGIPPPPPPIKADQFARVKKQLDIELPPPPPPQKAEKKLDDKLPPPPPPRKS